MLALDGVAVMVLLYFAVTLSFIILVARMSLSWRLSKRFGIEDGWMLLALCFLAGLWYAGTSVLYGTNNVLHPESLTPEQIRQREKGSKMVLVARLSYVSTYVGGATSHIPDYVYD